jgi:uncharacterized protein YjbI with pentapeptide repeats
VARPSRAPNPPEAPRLENDELYDVALDATAVVPAATFERVRVSGAELAGVRARGVAFARARLDEVDLAGAHLGGLALSDVAVHRGNLANVAAHELSLRRVEVVGARITGAQWTGGVIADTAFRDCRVDLATFAGTTFERAVFEGCLLAQADFREALFRSVRFEHCDLTEADLVGVRIDRCELRACTLEALAGVERLRGAAMPWGDVVGNAGLFAAALGIRVLDDDER